MFDFLKRKKKADAAGAPKPLPYSSLKQSLLSLEQRLMFDAAAAATAAEVKSEQVAQDQAEAAVSTEASHETTGAEKVESQDVLNALASYMPTESRIEVVFVDPTVPNYQELLAGMDPNTEVIMLDAGKDGVQQIADSLAGRTGVDAIHLISHGNAGELQLGTSHLTQESMTGQYANELVTIRQSLSEQADILIYGCDFAEGASGQAVVNRLAELTGADVEASNDLTGNAALGGDWDLEVKTGSIETRIAIDVHVQADWMGLLAAPTLDATKSPVLNSVAEDVGAPSGTVGTLVSSLVDFANLAGQVDNVTDSDVGAQLGIAVTGANTNNGTWWYSTNNGSTWNALGSVGEGSARLLAADASTRVYFQANADYNGTMSDAITFRAWDQTSGTAGGTADLTGGTSTVKDQFGSASYGNNNGTANWSGNWVETDSGGGGASGGKIRIEGGQLDIRAETLNNELYREADLSNATSATLSFSYNNALGSGDTIAVQVSSDGGAYYTTLTGGSFSNTLHTGSGTVSFDITSAISANTRVRFLVTAENDNNHLYVDNVQISYSSSGTGGNTAFSGSTDTAGLTVSSVNEAPTDLALSASTVAEQAATGTVVGTVSPTDPDAGDTHTYQLTDTAGGRFTINSTTGVITVADGSLLNYEAAASHSITVRTTDAGGQTYDETFTINLTNVNEAPSITSNGGGATASVSVAENSTTATTIAASDVDAGQTLTYSIAGGADAATFTINSSTGQLSFITAPNHEAPADSGGNNVYDVTVQVSDGSLTDSQAISVTVTNVNEAPVAVDDRAGLTFDGTNDFVDMGSGVAYEVTNTVTMEAWINREPSSNVRQLIINKEGEYEVGLDANGSLMWAFANTNPGWAWHDTGVVIPVHTWTHVAVTYDHGTITSYVNGVAVETYAGSGTIGDAHPTKDSLRIGSRENNPAGQYFAGQISEVQVWNTARTAGEVAGDQNGTLTGSETGLLGYWKFNENTGTTADNLTAHSDGTLGGGLANQDPQWATYRVNEDMTLTASGSGVLGNDYDVDGDTVLAIMVTGPSHASAFTLNPDGSFSYTPSANFSGTDSFTYRVSDGTNLSNVATVHIQVDPVNDAPTDLALSANTVAENAANGTVVGTVTGTDPDAGETQTYSLTDTAGGRFAINSSTGVITVADGSLLNYESAASHSVTVRVTDSDGLTYDEAFTINLTNVNEAPAITSNGGGGTATLAVAENQTAVTTVTATDVDAGTALTYSIAGGADSTRFSIDAATGALRFSAAPNFERPNDAGLNNVYDVTVQVSDGQGGTATQSISVRVTDVNEAPTITSNRGGDVAAVTIRENSTTVTTVRATDPDRGARMTYSVIGGADAALFSINSRTGALRFISAPNFEQPADSDGNNLYQVVVQASDGRGGTDSQTVNVTITDRNDAPHELDFTGGFVAEGAPNGTIVGQALVSDEDRADTATYSLVDDAGGRFAIHPGTGIITVANNALIDYDLAASHTVSVRVMDAGRLARTETFTIAVTNTNETPADILLAGDTVQENAPAGTVVGTVTTQDLDVSDTHTYSLVNDAGGRFAVDQNTGEITVADGSLLDHEGNTSHSIIVRSTDSGGLMIDRTFTITVSNVNEAPTTTTVPGPLLPGTPPPPTGVPMPPATSGPVGSGPADGPALGPASTPAPSLPDAARSVSPAAAPRVMPALASMAGPGHAREGETPVVLEDDREPIAWTVVEPAMNLLHEAADQLRTLAQLPEIPVTLSELIVKELDAMTASLEDAMQGRQDEDTLVAATAAGVSVVLSAGYLVWVVRGGWLVASLMATMPAWRSFDPLPVLVRAKEDREREGLRDDRRAPRREDQQIEHLFGSEGGRAA